MGDISRVPCDNLRPETKRKASLRTSAAMRSGADRATARAHLATCRRSRRARDRATRRPRATGEQAAHDRLLGLQHVFDRRSLDCRLRAAARRTRLDRGPHDRHRISTGRGPYRALGRGCSGICATQGRCHRRAGRRDRRGKAGDVGHPNRLPGGRRSGRRRYCRLARATGRQRYRPIAAADRARRKAPRTPARDRPRAPPVGNHGQHQRYRRRSGNARASGNGWCPGPQRHRVGNPPSGGDRARDRGTQGSHRCTLCCRRSAHQRQQGAHPHLGPRRATPDDVHSAGCRQCRRSDVRWTELPGPVPARRRICRQNFGRSRPTSRSSNRPGSISPSI